MRRRRRSCSLSGSDDLHAGALSHSDSLSCCLLSVTMPAQTICLVTCVRPPLAVRLSKRPATCRPASHWRHKQAHAMLPMANELTCCRPAVLHP